jgi:hypothetical protein
LQRLSRAGREFGWGDELRVECARRRGDPDLETARSVVVTTTGVGNFPDWTFLVQWLAAGCTLWEDVVPAIEARIRANRECDPAWYPRNLGCFDKAVRQARGRRVMEAFRVFHLATVFGLTPWRCARVLKLS